MNKQNNQEFESPIIIVQDSSYGNVSTTSTILAILAVPVMLYLLSV